MQFRQVHRYCVPFPQYLQVFHGIRILRRNRDLSRNIPETIRTQGLQDPDQDKTVEIPPEFTFIEACYARHHSNIMFKELLSEGFRQISFGIVKQRGRIILQGSFAPSLVSIK